MFNNACQKYAAKSNDFSNAEDAFNNNNNKFIHSCNID